MIRWMRRQVEVEQEVVEEVEEVLGNLLLKRIFNFKWPDSYPDQIKQFTCLLRLRKS